MELSQLKAVVSGGASGLGHAVAARLVAAGGRVAILDINEAQGREAAAALGEQALFFRTDVSREAEVNAAVEAAAEAFGGINLAVSCAGILGAGRVLGREGPMAGEHFAKVITVNLVGTFLLSKAAANKMQHNEPNAEGERGVIVNTASVAAFEGQIGQAAYSASKAGVAGMALPLAREFARLGIRVNTIAPGLFLTPMMEGMPKNVQQSLAAQVPFPSRLGHPAEFADLVLYICSNTMLNAETIRLDGAIRMQPK
ncbi:MAG TPA: SDR family NAD(P)-dependent oxidoreductase [Gammaproteobacteria bacterium]|nr:SDR family NAD(P)-dependent oxidoreductase [Gammaproteobacteria bacterium]